MMSALEGMVNDGNQTMHEITVPESFFGIIEVFRNRQQLLAHYEWR